MRPEIDPSQAFLVIEPTSDQARRALDLPLNEKCLVRSVIQPGSTAVDRYHRDNTPDLQAVQDFLELRLDCWSRNTIFGWAFGSDINYCDVLLDHNHRNGVSRFAFTVNISWATQDVWLLAGRRSILYKESNSHQKFVLEPNSHMLLQRHKSYTIYFGKVHFELSTVSRNHAEQAAFDHDFGRFLRTLDPAIPHRISFNDFQTLNMAEQPSVSALWTGFRAQYRVLDIVYGGGACGSVHKVCNDATGKIYAIKRLILYGINDEVQKAEFKREIQFLRLLRHPRIVKFIDDDAEYTFLVMEALEGGSLNEQFSIMPFSNHEVEIILHDMLDALVHIHSNGLIHFDVKPDNILVKRRNAKELVVKLADFGFTSSRANTKYSRGTLDFGAPELFDSNGPYSSSVDLWSLGLLVFQLIWEIQPPDRSENEWFKPQSRFADGWRGRVRRAIGELLYQLDMIPASPELEPADPETPDSLEEDEPDSGYLLDERPHGVLASVLDTLLQVTPHERGTAFGALKCLRKCFGIGYFLSLDSVPEGSTHQYCTNTGSPPIQVIARSPITELEDEPLERPVDLDEYFQMEPNKSTNFIMTRDRLYVEPDSLFDASGSSDQADQKIIARMVRHLDNDYITVEDAPHVCEKLRLQECKTLLEAELHSHYCSTSSPSFPDSNATPTPENHQDPEAQIEVPLSPKIPIAALRYLGLVCLDDIYEFAGIKGVACNELIAQKRESIPTFRVLVAGGDRLDTYIQVKDAIALAYEHGELFFLRKELMRFRQWLVKEQKGEDVDICDRVLEMRVVVLAFTHRVVLIRMGDGEVDTRSLGCYLRNEKLEVRDWEGMDGMVGMEGWCDVGDLENWGVFDESHLEVLEMGARLARREGVM